MYLEINNLYKGFGEADSRVEVLKDISFGVEKGEICVMLGPSGSGKSTLLNIVGGIESADSGSVRVGEDELEAMNEKKLSGYRRKHLGYIFQSYNLIGNLTVKENIEVGGYLTDDPLRFATTITTIPAGSKVTYLTTMTNQNGQVWDYIETTVNGQPVRGFIPAGNIEVPEEIEEINYQG